MFILISIISLNTHGQDLTNIHRTELVGTARTLGLSGAQSAIGADLGSFNANPAALGIFRKSEILFTPCFKFQSNKSDLLGKESSTTTNSPLVKNFGVVFSTTDDNKKSGLKNYTFGISYTRMATFNKSLNVSSFNRNNSYSTYLGELATKQFDSNPGSLNINTIIDPVENLGQMAWKSELINSQGDSLFYGIAENGRIEQTLEVVTEGFNNSWDFGLGTNFEDYIYFGASVKIKNYEFNSDHKISESDVEDTITNLDFFKYTEEYASFGNGIGISLGAIFKPTNFWRLGVSYQGGMAYKLISIRSYSLTDVNVDDKLETPLLKSYKLQGPSVNLELNTAPKITIGNYVQMQKLGFISTDIEYNFAKGMSSAEEFFNNQFVVKNGVELRNKKLRYRGGIAIYNSLLTSAVNQMNASWSLGLGFRNELFFADLALVHDRNNSEYSPYYLDSGLEPAVETITRNNSVSITLGSRF